MLTMEQIHNIKYLFKNKGKTLRKISSETGHHFNTVKKNLRKDFAILQEQNMPLHCLTELLPYMAPVMQLGLRTAMRL